jgi:uncharacterized protein (DUF58 family)
MIALPTKRFVFIAAVPLGASVLLLPYFYLTGQDLPVLPILAAVNLTLFGIYLSDWLTIPLAKRFSAERDPEGVLLQLATHKIGLSVAFHKRKSRRIPVRIFDDLHPFMESKAFPLDTMLSPGKNQFHYHVSVPRRGSYDLRYVHLTVFGALRLVRKVYRLPCESTLRVYPDLRSISKLMLLSRTSRLSFMGIRRVRTWGGDTEFERLREYTRDDDFRRIDWKATARQRKFMVRQYQQSRNQTVMFMLDCGRMMTAESNGKSILDHALSSVLLLARVALDQGDRVGILAFSSRILRYVAPVAGSGKHRNLVSACYDLFPTHEETNFDLAFRHLAAANRKRSLVCLVTNVIDDANANMIRSHLEVMGGRHLPFAVLVKMREIHEMAEDPRENPFVAQGVNDFLEWRRGVIHRLSSGGVLTLESYPDQMETGLINQYLWIKARHLL